MHGLAFDFKPNKYYVCISTFLWKFSEKIIYLIKKLVNLIIPNVLSMKIIATFIYADIFVNNVRSIFHAQIGNVSECILAVT